MLLPCYPEFTRATNARRESARVIFLNGAHYRTRQSETVRSDNDHGTTVAGGRDR